MTFPRDDGGYPGRCDKMKEERALKNKGERAAGNPRDTINERKGSMKQVKQGGGGMGLKG